MPTSSSVDGSGAMNGLNWVTLMLSNCQVLPLLALPARSRSVSRLSLFEPNPRVNAGVLADSGNPKFGFTQKVSVSAAWSILPTNNATPAEMGTVLSAPAPLNAGDTEVAPQFAEPKRSPSKNFSVLPAYKPIP